MKTMIDNAKSKATAPVGITAVVMVLAASGGYWAMLPMMWCRVGGQRRRTMGE